MTTTQHTPGPWRYEPDTKTIRSVPANYWLATMDSWDGAVSNAANACLIIAAPDMLAFIEAAEGVIAWAKDHGADPAAMDALEAMREAANAKAIGAR